MNMPNGLAGELDPSGLAQQRTEERLGLDPGQALAGAAVDAVAEDTVIDRVTVQVEPVGLGVVPLLGRGTGRPDHRSAAACPGRHRPRRPGGGGAGRLQHGLRRPGHADRLRPRVRHARVIAHAHQCRRLEQAWLHRVIEDGPNPASRGRDDKHGAAGGRRC